MWHLHAPSCLNYLLWKVRQYSKHSSPPQQGSKLQKLWQAINYMTLKSVVEGNIKYWLDFQTGRLEQEKTSRLNKFLTSQAYLCPLYTSYTVKSNKSSSKVSIFYCISTCSSKSWWCVAAFVWSWGLGFWGMAQRSGWWSPAKPFLCVSPGTHRCGDVSHS